MALLRPAWTDAPELMDQPGHRPAVLAENLGDLRRVNRYLGGIDLTLRGLERLLAGAAPGNQVALLDVATGGADIPRVAAGWLRRRGLRPRVVAADVSAEILAVATPGSDVRLLVADGRRLPFADG